MTNAIELKEAIIKKPEIVVSHLAKALTGNDVKISLNQTLRNKFKKEVESCVGGYFGDAGYGFSQKEVDSCMLKRGTEFLVFNDLVNKNKIKNHIKNIGLDNAIKSVGEELDKALTEITKIEEEEFLKSL